MSWAWYNRIWKINGIRAKTWNKSILCNCFVIRKPFFYFDFHIHCCKCMWAWIMSLVCLWSNKDLVNTKKDVTGCNNFPTWERKSSLSQLTPNSLTLLKSSCAGTTLGTPHLLKNSTTFVQSLYKNSRACGWNGSTDWLTSINHSFSSCHSMLYSLRSAWISLHCWYIVHMIWYEWFAWNHTKRKKNRQSMTASSFLHLLLLRILYLTTLGLEM